MQNNLMFNPIRFLVNLLVILLISSIHSSNANTYVVRVDSDNKRIAYVTAQITIQNSQMTLNDSAEDTGLINGWATFIHKISATTIDGKTINIHYVGNGIWQLPKLNNPKINLAYQVLLQHDRFPNQPGDDELAYAQDWGVMWTGRALFITSKDERNIDVKFNLPNDWKATTPWHKVINKDHEFIVGNNHQLNNSAFMLGKHLEQEVSLGGSIIRIGLGGETLGSQVNLISSIVTKYMQSYTKLFNSSAKTNMVLLASDGRHNGGGVMGSSISMVFNGELNMDKLMLLQYITTHEMYHLWNAHLNYRDEDSMYWFIEGFAEYMTYMTAVKLGDIPSEFFLSQLAERYNKYNRVSGTLSLADAGKQKLDNYDLIYSGGMMVALVLDLTIRDKSHQKFSLETIHKDIYSQFKSGSSSSSMLSNQSLAELIKKVTLVDVDDILKNVVMKNHKITIKEILNTVGLVIVYDNEKQEYTISVSSNTSQQLSSNLVKWLH